jgi:hypothetical protein
MEVQSEKVAQGVIDSGEYDVTSKFAMNAHKVMFSLSNDT